MIRLAIRIALAIVALSAAQMIAGGVVAITIGLEALPETAPGALPFQILSNAVIVGVLAWFARRSRWRGWRLAGGLALVLYGTLSFNSIIEALFFGLFPLRTALIILLLTALTTAIFAPALLLLGRREPLPAPNWELRVTLPRLAAGAATYVLLYFVFGLIIYPFVASFYEGLATPGLAAVVAMQFLIRGPIFVGLAALVAAMSGAGRIETILMIVAALVAIGGIAPLIVPTPLFPDAVRWVHFVEVTTENFIFGIVLGFLLTRRRSDEPSREANAVAAAAA